MTSVPVQMPKLTMNAIEATFVEWLVADGASVEEDEALYVVATDKVETEVLAPASGVLRHGAAQADVAYAIGTELAVIETG